MLDLQGGVGNTGLAGRRALRVSYRTCRREATRRGGKGKASDTARRRKGDKPQRKRGMAHKGRNHVQQTMTLRSPARGGAGAGDRHKRRSRLGVGCSCGFRSRLCVALHWCRSVAISGYAKQTWLHHWLRLRSLQRRNVAESALCVPFRTPGCTILCLPPLPAQSPSQRAAHRAMHLAWMSLIVQPALVAAVWPFS